MDGRSTSNLPVITDHIIKYYKQLLSKQYTWRLSLDGLVFESLDYQETSWRERPFEEFGDMEDSEKDCG